MSDYDDYDYNYQEPQEQMEDEPGQEEDIQTVLEVDFFNAEALIRENKHKEAIEAMRDIYKTAVEHNVKGYKMKVQNQLLIIFVQNKNEPEVKKTLKQILDLSEKENFTENTIRGIIQTLQTLESKVYESYWNDLMSLIEKQDGVGKLKSYLLMLKKELAEKSKNCETLYKKVKETIRENEVPTGSLIEVYSLEIKYHKLKNLPMESLLKKIQLNIPLLEEETMTNDTSLSEIKESVAEVLYEEGSYKECATYLCDCFAQNAKFGKNTESIKAILKLNILVLLLCKNKELLDKKDFNPLLHESTANFKMDQDIQALFGLVDAFNNLQISRFSEIFKIIDTGSFYKPYNDIYDRAMNELKKEKLLYIAKPYRTVTFDYLSKRLSESADRIPALIFDLIVEKKINGAIHLKEKYLEMLPEENYYFTTQMSNLKQLAQRL